MKLNKVSMLFKFVLIAFLIANSDARTLSKKNFATIQRFRNNFNRFQSKFINLKLQDVGNVMFGVIKGFLVRELEILGKTAEMTYAYGKLTIETLGVVFKDCLNYANKKFEENSEAINRAKKFNIFISVLPGTIAARRMDKYLSNCEAENEDKDYKYTEDHKVFLAKTLEIMKQFNNKKSPDYGEITPEETEIIQELQLAHDYFAYKDMSRLNYYTSSEYRTICSYFNNKDNWQTILKRWFDYGTNILTCGAGGLVSKFFSDSKIFLPLLTDAIYRGFTQYLGLGVFRLIRAIYRFTVSVMYGNSSYFAIGETLGKEIADNMTPWKLTEAKRRRYKK